MAIKPNLTFSLMSQTQRIFLPILFWPEAYNASGFGVWVVNHACEQ